MVHHRLRRRRLPKRRVVQPQQRLRGPADGAVAVRFGGNPAAPNHLDIFEVSSPARILLLAPGPALTPLSLTWTGVDLCPAAVRAHAGVLFRRLGPSHRSLVIARTTPHPTAHTLQTIHKKEFTAQLTVLKKQKEYQSQRVRELRDELLAPRRKSNSRGF